MCVCACVCVCPVSPPYITHVQKKLTESQPCLFVVVLFCRKGDREREQKVTQGGVNDDEENRKKGKVVNDPWPVCSQQDEFNVC